jgi:hypothetical protein
MQSMMYYKLAKIQFEQIRIVSYTYKKNTKLWIQVQCTMHIFYIPKIYQILSYLYNL